MVVRLDDRDLGTATHAALTPDGGGEVVLLGLERTAARVGRGLTLDATTTPPTDGGGVVPNVQAPTRVDSGWRTTGSYAARSAMPRMPLSGVRSSWLTVARKRDLATLAASARLLASSSARASARPRARSTRASSAAPPAKRTTTERMPSRLDPVRAVVAANDVCPISPPNRLNTEKRAKNSPEREAGVRLA